MYLTPAAPPPPPSVPQDGASFGLLRGMGEVPALFAEMGRTLSSSYRHPAKLGVHVGAALAVHPIVQAGTAAVTELMA